MYFGGKIREIRRDWSREEGAILSYLLELFLYC